MSRATFSSKVLPVRVIGWALIPNSQLNSLSSNGLGFGLKGHDSTARSSGLGIGTAQKVACGLKVHDCAFVHGAQVVV